MVVMPMQAIPEVTRRVRKTISDVLTSLQKEPLSSKYHLKELKKLCTHIAVTTQYNIKNGHSCLFSAQLLYNICHSGGAYGRSRATFYFPSKILFTATEIKPYTSGKPSEKAVKTCKVHCYPSRKQSLMGPVDKTGWGGRIMLFDVPPPNPPPQ